MVRGRAGFKVGAHPSDSTLPGGVGGGGLPPGRAIGSRLLSRVRQLLEEAEFDL
jgi:hypothetical protein